MRELKHLEHGDWSSSVLLEKVNSALKAFYDFYKSADILKELYVVLYSNETNGFINVAVKQEFKVDLKDDFYVKSGAKYWAALCVPKVMLFKRLDIDDFNYLLTHENYLNKKPRSL